MSIQYAILGLLSWQPFSGYDLKKRFANSPAFYWSGNNNQIYKALVELHRAGWVTQETQHQESLPARKIYTITAAGREALKAWLLTTPEPPEFRNGFLAQLAWADSLEASALDDLLARYEEGVRVQVLMEQEKARRSPPAPARTRRETYLWAMITQNVISAYENELRWVQEVRAGLKRQRTTRKEQAR